MKPENSIMTHELQQNSSRLHQVFGNKLKVEEKLQVLDALVSTSEESNELLIGCCQRPQSCGICSIDPFHTQYHVDLKHEKPDHQASRVYKCNYCQNEFPHSLIRGTCQTNSKRTKFSCQLCDKSFYKRSDLRIHLATHLSIHGSVCEVCGRTFSHISNLIRHSYIHTGIKPYPCKICGKRFRQASSLKQHKISHHDNQPIPCPALPHQCSKMFRTPVIARQHAYREHPNVSWKNSIPKSLCNKTQRCYYCRSCGEEFRHLKYLKAHNLDHLKNRDCMKENVRFCWTKSVSKVNQPVSVYPENNKEDHKCFAYKMKNIKNDCETASIAARDSLSGTVNEIEIEEHVYKVLDPCICVSTQTSFRKTPEVNIDCNEKPLKNLEELGNFDTNCKHVNYTESLIENMFCGNEQPMFFVKKSTSGGVEIENTADPAHNQIKGNLHDRNDSSSNIVINSLFKNANSDSKGINNSDKCMLEISNDVGHFENQNTLGLDIEGANRKQKDHICGEEDVLHDGTNVTNVTYDVNMGLCLDSPSDSFDDDQISKFQCPNEEEDLQDSDLRDHFGQTKCISVQDNYQMTEPLILSFGDSYSALLKEIGIVEEDTHESGGKSSYVHTKEDDDKIQQKVMCQWERNATISGEEGTNDQGDMKTLKTICTNYNSECDNEESVAPYEDEIQINSLPPSCEQQKCNSLEDTGSTDNVVLTMEFSNDMISLLPKTSAESESFVIYVAQDNRQAEIVPQVLVGGMEISFPTQLNSAQVLKEKQTKVNNACSLSPFIKAAPDSRQEHPLAAKKKKGNDTKLRHSINLVQVNEPAQGMKSDKMACLLQPSAQDFETAKPKPNRTKKKCPECGKIFFKGSNLMQHLGLHFPNMKKYKCDFCNQSFSWKSSLNKHMTSHASASQQFLCDICGKQYKSFDQVKQHKKRDHEGLRPYICEVCNTSFFRHYDLVVHQRIHENKKPFMCDTCGKTFNHLSHVKRHENVHLKDKIGALSLHSTMIELK